MRISYAIPVHNERAEIERLLVYLMEKKRDVDEIIVMLDSSSVTKEVRDYVEDFVMTNEPKDISVISHPLNRDFATHKNFLNRHCNGDWIFQIDADEYPDSYLIEMLHHTLEDNPNVEAYYVPRINEVSGITPYHLRMWGWNVDDRNRVNFPDYQMRIYRNKECIHWIRPVHEQLVGYKGFGKLPANDEYCLWHPKDINRQEMQNKFYDTI
ncbi:MAG: glycosyltransferase [Pelagibacterales bacterium]|nr:glycosyltransferase [Pelagibacterales bacterium]